MGIIAENGYSAFPPQVSRSETTSSKVVYCHTHNTLCRGYSQHILSLTDRSTARKKEREREGRELDKMHREIINAIWCISSCGTSFFCNFCWPLAKMFHIEPICALLNVSFDELFLLDLPGDSYHLTVSWIDYLILLLSNVVSPLTRISCRWC